MSSIGVSPVFSRGRLNIPRGAKIEDVEIDVETVRGPAKSLRDRGMDVPDFFLSPKHVSRISGVLFEREPQLEDINQQQLGDCWFLSALGATVALGGPMVFQFMMFDAGDSVIVQVWDQVMLPRYLRVEKSTIEVSGKFVFHARGGLWAIMLEKAMTAFQKSGSEDDGNLTLRLEPKHASYNNLSGGFSSNAFRALLGVEADYTNIDDSFHNDIVSSDFVAFKAILKGDDVNYLILQDLFGAISSNGSAYMLYSVWWARWAQASNLYLTWVSEWGGKTGLGGVYRRNDFEAFLDRIVSLHAAKWRLADHPLSVFIAALKSWAQRKQVFAEKRGTGIYNTAQLNLYQQVVNHLLARQPCCLGTKAVVGTPAPILGSSGETISKGLGGQHAYGVIGAHYDRNTGIRYVQVFNPWGHTGRGYSFAPNSLHMKPVRSEVPKILGGQTAYQTDSAVFWLELADVTKRCSKFYFCQETPRLIKAACGLQQVPINVT